MIGVPPWLPLLVIFTAPDVTADRGTLSASCSSRRRATTLRGLPRTIACDCTHSSRSLLASYVQAVTGVTSSGTGHPTPCESSAFFGSKASASGPPLSRIFVFQVTFWSSSTLRNTADAGLAEPAATRLAAFGQRRSAGPVERQVPG